VKGRKSQRGSKHAGLRLLFFEKRFRKQRAAVALQQTGNGCFEYGDNGEIPCVAWEGNPKLSSVESKRSIENGCFHFLAVFFLLQLGGSILFRSTNDGATRFAESLSRLGFISENCNKNPG